MAKKGLDKEMVLLAAIDIADEKGLNNVTLKELANRLNVKTPSLYNHIDGLQGLYSMLALYGLQKLKNELIDAVIGLSGSEAIYSMGTAYFHFAKKNPGLYEATQWVNCWKSEEAKNNSDEIIHIVGRVLKPLALDDTNLTHVIRMFRSVLHGFAVLEKNKGFGNPISIDESFDLAMAILMDGVQTKFGGERTEDND